MKKVSLIFLLLSIAIIIYFFIKEQFKGITLSSRDNIILSITYLLVGISLLILLRLKHLGNKQKENKTK
jgi:hypothetical protein